MASKSTLYSRLVAMLRARPKKEENKAAADDPFVTNADFVPLPGVCAASTKCEAILDAAITITRFVLDEYTTNKQQSDQAKERLLGSLWLPDTEIEKAIEHVRPILKLLACAGEMASKEPDGHVREALHIFLDSMDEAGRVDTKRATNEQRKCFVALVENVSIVMEDKEVMELTSAMRGLQIAPPAVDGQ